MKKVWYLFTSYLVIFKFYCHFPKLFFVNVVFVSFHCINCVDQLEVKENLQQIENNRAKF